MNQEKIAELFSDKEFLEKALQMTPEELQRVLEEQGVDVSVEEIADAGRMLNEVFTSDGELSEAALEQVAGGKGGFWTALIATLAVGGTAMGYLVVVAITMGLLPW